MTHARQKLPSVADRQVVLVDESGQAIGAADKVAAHRGAGQLHRAFTCLLFDSRRRLLFARRALGKLLWPGYWDATVATHQRPDESDAEAASRRVTQELGVEVTDLVGPATLCYHAIYNEHWSEREHCAVLLGRVAGEPNPAPGEIDACDAVSRDELRRFVSGHAVTPWFDLAWTVLQRDHADELDRWWV